MAHLQAESLLIANGKLKTLVATQRWDTASLVGEQALEIADGIATADGLAMAELACLAASAPLPFRCLNPVGLLR